MQCMHERQSQGVVAMYAIVHSCSVCAYVRVHVRVCLCVLMHKRAETRI